MKQDNPFIILVKRKIFQNKSNYVISFTGAPGTGKSYAALDFCKTFDPTFDISRVCFTLEEFFELMIKLDNDDKVGKAIMLDEAGVAGNSKKTMHQEQIAYGEILKMMRFKRNLFVITSPGFNDYIKDGRVLVDAWVHFSQDKDLEVWKKVYKKTFAWLRLLTFNQYDNKTYHRRLRLESGELLDKLIFDFPEELVKEYETRKHQNFRSKLEENLAIIKRKRLKMQLGMGKYA